MSGSNALDRMRELVERLNAAAFAYYVEDKELISNFEYDRLYDELLALERATGTVLPGSPTQDAGAGYKAVSKLVKSEHEFPALSLDKTKDREALPGWLNGRAGVLSWKLDGLTVVLTYRGGRLEKAVTRGNGIVGEDVTHNVVHFGGVPRRISFDGKLIVRGEAVMKYADFERVNRELPETDAKYKNPRNLASATVRLLDASEAATRPVTVYVFDLVYAENGGAPLSGVPADNSSGEASDKAEYDLLSYAAGKLPGQSVPQDGAREAGIGDPNSKNSQFDWLAAQGFTVVEHTLVTPETVVAALERFERRLPENAYPTDGLVLILDDEKYGKSLGSTGKFPRNGIAFKWQDETAPTCIRSVEWSASRTGLLNPVAIFDPVELEGTTVSRASVHNVSIARGLRLGIGSKVLVYKANLIIPQIAETVESLGETPVPEFCPVCGMPTRIAAGDGVETLYCDNPECAAKHVGRFTHFVARDAMNVMGLSEATLELFIDAGYVRRFADLYHLERFRERIVTTEGFGEKSYDNLMAALEASRTVKFSALLNAVGIPGIGKDMAKQISRFLGAGACGRFLSYIGERADFSVIEGVGSVINDNIYAWAADPLRFDEFTELLPELVITDDVRSVNNSAGTGNVGATNEATELSGTGAESSGTGAVNAAPLAGLTFVITGSLEQFANRDQLVDFIEERGGRTSGSVSAKTSYLINNNVESTSGKNKKAKELGVKIISEADFLELAGGLPT